MIRGNHPARRRSVAGAPKHRARCFGSAEKSRVWAARMSGAVVDLVCSDQLSRGLRAWQARSRHATGERIGDCDLMRSTSASCARQRWSVRHGPGGSGKIMGVRYAPWGRVTVSKSKNGNTLIIQVTLLPAVGPRDGVSLTGKNARGLGAGSSASGGGSPRDFFHHSTTRRV